MTTKKRTRGQPRIALIIDSQVSAKAAGLRYVTDASPGIRRQRAGKGFTYLTGDGTRLRDRHELQRITSLRIPPAWTKVWICPMPHGHLQATGYDAKGRKQYRYHPRWRDVRDETKYGRMLAFGEALPRIRQQVEHDMALTWSTACEGTRHRRSSCLRPRSCVSAMKSMRAPTTHSA